MAQHWMSHTDGTTVSVLYIRTWRALILFIEVTVFTLIHVLLDCDNPCEHQMCN